MNAQDRCLSHATIVLSALLIECQKLALLAAPQEIRLPAEFN
jgi:hypothetical protein